MGDMMICIIFIVEKALPQKKYNDNTMAKTVPHPALNELLTLLGRFA